jgi:hypothetical protein
MGKQYNIRAPHGITSKLMAVRAIKRLTELGLKEAKSKIDDLLEGDIHVMVEFNTSDLSENEIKEMVGEAQAAGVVFSNDRERNLNIALTLFKVIVPTARTLYRVITGTYEVLDNNVLKLNIKEGTKEDITESLIVDEELNNMVIVLPFTNCILEENI